MTLIGLDRNIFFGTATAKKKDDKEDADGKRVEVVACCQSTGLVVFFCLANPSPSNHTELIELLNPLFS